MALVKYNNNSISAITAASGLGNGAMTLIKSQTASSSATISFVHGTSDVVLDSTYPIYKFVWINCHPSQQSGDGEEFQFNMSVDSGSNYNVTKTSSYFIATHQEDDGGTSFGYTDGHDQAQETGSQRFSVDNEGDNDSSNSGSMLLFNPSSTTYTKHFMIVNNYMHSTPMPINTYVAGYGNTTSAVNAVKFEFSAGTIESGTIKLYGIKDS